MTISIAFFAGVGVCVIVAGIVNAMKNKPTKAMATRN